MKLDRYLAVFVSVVAVVLCGEKAEQLQTVESLDDKKGPPPPEPPHPNPNPTSSTSTSSTTSSTTSGTTTLTTSRTTSLTTSRTTSLTTSPTSSTITPTTSSTITPTTSSPITKPTTSSTTSSTSVPTSPRPPTPTPPEIGKWSVDLTKNSTSCLLVSAAIQLQILYITSYNSTFRAYVNVPINATTDGSCKDTESTIAMTWNKNKLAFNFARNGTKYYLNSIKTLLTPDEKTFPFANDTKPIELKYTHNAFETTTDKSYKCNKQQFLNLTDESQVVKGEFSVSDFQFEAFHNSTNHKFASAEDCAPFDTPDIVPIGVGCALAALVLIVLVAYLIGRRRRQAHGYLSM